MGCYVWFSEQPSPLLVVPTTKCNSPPITGQCIPITVLLCDGPLVCGFNVAIKELKNAVQMEKVSFPCGVRA